MVKKETMENYKKELFDLALHLENWLNGIVIESWDAENLRNRVVSKIRLFKQDGHTDVFHPDIDRGQVVERMKEQNVKS